MKRRRFLTASTALASAPFLSWSSSSLALPAAAAVAKRYAEGILVVEDSVGKGANGFFVSSTGLLCTVLARTKVNDRLSVSGDAALGQADVIAVDDDGLVLAQLAPAPEAPVTALGLSPTGKRSRWLVGLMRSDKGVSAVVGGEEDSGLLVPVPKGAPILDDADQVIAVASRRRGGGSVDVIASSRVIALAKRARG